MEQSGAQRQTGLIRNRAKLRGHGQLQGRRQALAVAEAGLAACDPGAAAERVVRLDGDELVIDGRRRPLSGSGRIVVVGAGKATLKIALALERALGDRLDGGIIAVRRGEAFARPARVAVVEAGHPIPDDESFHAASLMLDVAGGLDSDDLLLACFTGGSSALASLPPAGVGFAEKRDLHEKLLAAGLPIGEVNAVRKQVSAFKGGRLALAAAPAPVVNLTVSDVAGDRLDVLTDPSVQDRSTPEQARSILRDSGLWDEVAPSIRATLDDPGAATPDLAGVEIETTLLVTGEAACEAMAASAEAAGLTPRVLGTTLEEEARPLGAIIGGLAAESATHGRPFPNGSVLIGCGGEATVTLGPGGRFGSGGPNHELALAAATRIAGLEVAAVFIDTDGSDGGTDVAGAVADGETAKRAAAAGIDLHAALAGHRSGPAVAALADGIETGPTHTNVNDLFVIVVG